MKLSDYRLIFVSICLIGVLLIASPVFVEFTRSHGETFSELFLLGPDNMAQDIPFNIIPNQIYTVHIGVGNHMGETTYYVCAVKLRCQPEQSPNNDAQTASSLPSLYEYHLVIQNDESWFEPLTFSISAVSPAKYVSVLQSITINNVEFNVDKLAHYDPDSNGYYYQLFVELWAYNSASEAIQYQNRWIYFWFNATSPVI